MTKYSILCLLVSTNFVLDILTPKGSQMKSYNYTVLELVEHRNFDIGYVTVLVHLKNSKNWFLKYENFKYIFEPQNDLE